MTYIETCDFNSKKHSLIYSGEWKDREQRTLKFDYIIMNFVFMDYSLID